MTQPDYQIQIPGTKTSGNFYSLRSALVTVATLIVLAVVAALLIANPSFERFLEHKGAFAYLEPQEAGIRNGIVAVLSVFAGTFMFVPLLAMYAGNDFVFGVFWGSIFSLLGIIAAGTVQFILGRILHGPFLRRVRSDLINKLREKFNRAGPWPIAVLRILPIAPFIIVNIAAGALKIRLTDFTLGNAIGSLVPIVLAGAFAFELERIAQTSHLRTFFWLIIFLSAIVFAGTRIWRGIKRQKSNI